MVRVLASAGSAGRGGASALFYDILMTPSLIIYVCISNATTTCLRFGFTKDIDNTPLYGNSSIVDSLA